MFRFMRPQRSRSVHNAEERREAFERLNEKPVDDISLELFYKPHTITLLAVSIIAVMYFAFVR